jgi:DNA-binding XRE family transcriptional regulator
MSIPLPAADARRWAADGTARRLREHAMLTQAEVAEVVGVTPAAVAAWEAGRRAPSGHAARKYGELLRQLNGKEKS